jgi:hypothetical protein
MNQEIQPTRGESQLLAEIHRQKSMSHDDDFQQDTRSPICLQGPLCQQVDELMEHFKRSGEPTNK